MATDDDGRARADACSSLTRGGIWVLLVLAAANGLFLYLVPAQAETDYAWAIKPPVNAAFIGAGFLAGTLATGLVLRFATRWRSFSTLPIALWVLASSLLLATLIHNDRFKWDYPPTWVWTFVYAAVPLAIPFLVMRQRANADDAPPADPRLKPLKVVSAIFGVVMLAGAIALFLAPVELGEHWVWPLTPLLARAVAAWYALFGTILLSSAVGLRRPADGDRRLRHDRLLEHPAAAPPVLHPDDVSGAGWWIAGMVALLALAVYALALAWPQRREL